MKRTFKSLLAVAGLAFIGVGALLTATPAQAAIVCDAQGVSLNNYPLDGNGSASNTHAFRCKNTVTGVKPTDARSNEYFTNIQALPANVKSVLKSRGVKFFFFNNRDEANEYFNSTSPYAGRPNEVFASSTARCGQTGYHPTIGIFGELQQTIAVAIYDLCTVTKVAGPYQNPDLKRIPYHEAGHAFDFALASQKTNGRDKAVSSATGSQNLFAYDKGKLTPSNWSTGTPAMTQSQRYNYLCNLFSISNPSGLEIDLGFTTNTGGPSGKVCQTVSLPYPAFQPITKTPSVVAAEKFPYFWNTPKESWAELFVIVATGNNLSGPNTLPTVDRVYGMNQSPIRSFNCTRAVIQWYISNATTSTSGTLPEPTAANLPSGCTPNGPLR
ncbi:MAG: hypothetical protein BWY75_00158 [bacterium ADurb.Bin425]|jgi:hypothetical protein|nr:MAG: hypothetical protein BWY75_00158 [bacterium ADurb.Bin425]